MFLGLTSVGACQSAYSHRRLMPPSQIAFSVAILTKHARMTKRVAAETCVDIRQFCLDHNGGLWRGDSTLKITSIVALTRRCQESFACLHHLPRTYEEIKFCMTTSLGERFQDTCEQQEVRDELNAIAQLSKAARARRFPELFPCATVIGFFWDKLASLFHVWLANYHGKTKTAAMGGSSHSISVCKNNVALESLGEDSWQQSAEKIIAALPPSSIHDNRSAWLQPLSADDFLHHLVMHCERACGVEVDREAMRDVLAPLWITLVEPTEFLAYTTCRNTGTMQGFLGVELSKALRAYTFGVVFNVPLPESSKPVHQLLLQELVNTRCELARLQNNNEAESKKGMHHDGQEVETIYTHRRRRMHKTSLVEYVLKTRIAFRHAPTALAEAEQLMHFLRTDERKDIWDSLDVIGGVKRLVRHLPLLDMAVDAYVADELKNTERCYSFSSVSDESPSEKPRYCGLRFQITFVFVLVFQHPSRWEMPEFDRQYPFRRKRYPSESKLELN